MENIEKLLNKEGIIQIKHEEPLSNHTTMKVGGPAELFVEPQSIEEIKKIITLLNEQQINWRAIGRGSNLLIPDEGMKGVVIKLGNGLDHLHIDGEVVRVGAGYSLIKLVTLLSKDGLAGLEFAGGIPGSIGGAVYMNAGAHGSDMASIVKRANILFPDGSLKWLTNEELKFSYRTSVLQTERPGIVIEAEMELKKGDRDTIVSRMQEYKDYRRNTQPWNYPCSGSIFRNPLPNYAGKLIEDAGLKGFELGGAKISEKHANFIVNTGNAKAEDVFNLIEYITSKIEQEYAITLETEVEIIGKKK